MNTQQQSALKTNTALWNKAMDFLLVCPFEKEQQTINFLHELNVEKNQIMESERG